MKSYLAWIIFGLSALVCLYWVGSGVRTELREDAVFYDIIQERQRLAKSSDRFRLGVVGSFEHHGQVLDGLNAAAQELNTQGGILNRQVEFAVLDDHGTVDGALAAAQAFATDPTIPVVMGHTDGRLNIAVAQNYAFYKMLCFSPNAPLSGSGHYAMQFSNGLSPRQLSQALLELAQRHGWHRIGLIYTKTDINQNQARLFESLADEHLMQVPLSMAYTGQDLSAEMEQWQRELGLDGLILSIDTATTARLMKAFRAAGMTMPLVSTGPIPSQNVLNDISGNDLFFLNAENEASVQHLPVSGSDFATAYEALMLLARAAEQAGSLLPEDLATSLAKLELTPPLIATTHFDENGNAVKAGLAFTHVP